MLLREHAPEDYCYRQVLKMCFFLQKVRNIEVLSLNCEFIQDQNDIIWLSHVSDIVCRPKK